MKADYDFIIIGGNMVGSAIALNLALHSYKVALIERDEVDYSQKFDHQKPFELRVSAIIPPVVEYFKHLGVWDDICKRRYQNFDRMTVWENSIENAFHFEAQEIAQEYLGVIIENTNIQSVLWQHLSQCDHAQFFQNSWADIEEGEQGIGVTLDSGQTIRGQLLIAADGAQSKIRNWCGIECVSKDYNQACIVGTVQCDKFHENTCWQRYHDGLAFAFLPLNDRHCSIAWYVDKKDKDVLLEDESIEETLFEISQGVLGKVTQSGVFSAFPLYRQRATHWYKGKVVLVGDAAHSVHPMAGQGANLGLIDAAVLAEEIIKAGRFYTYEIVKKRYQRRRSDTIVIELGMDAISTFFQAVPQFLQTNREKMLTFANDVPPFKRVLSRYGSGLSRDLPASMTNKAL